MDGYIGILASGINSGISFTGRNHRNHVVRRGSQRFRGWFDEDGRLDLKTKHVITSPVVIFNGDKAIAETNAIVVGDNAVLGVGCEGHARFYDRVEKRDGFF